MAALWWDRQVRDLTDPDGGGGDQLRAWREAIKDGLVRDGYTDVRVNSLEVAGAKGGCWVSIAHFNIAGEKFWEVVMVGGAGGPDSDPRPVAEHTVLIINAIVG